MPTRTISLSIMDSPRLYTELADWWALLSAPAEYAEEASIYRAALEAIGGTSIRTLLELGSGGGNNALHLGRRFDMTLTDLSEAMLRQSRALNPRTPHVQGDMRTIRLGRTFDGVFVHDAIMYLTTEADVRAMLETARVHCAPGGVLLLVPDDTRETWHPETRHGGHDAPDGRGLRYVSWSYDSDPSDTEYATAYAILLRSSSGEVRAVTDLHRAGLFPRAIWLRLLDDAGFEPRTLPYRHSTFAPGADHELFLGRRR